MKRLSILCLTVAIVLSFGVTMVGCTGAQARDNILIPTLRLADDGVRLDVERGTMDAVEDGDITQVDADVLLGHFDTMSFLINEGEREQLASFQSRWLEFRAMAERGIEDRVEDGEWVQGVADSAVERLNQFGDALGVVPQ